MVATARTCGGTVACRLPGRAPRAPSSRASRQPRAGAACSACVRAPRGTCPSPLSALRLARPRPPPDPPLNGGVSSLSHAFKHDDRDLALGPLLVLVVLGPDLGHQLPPQRLLLRVGG